MSTAMRDGRVATLGQPISRRRSAASPSWKRGLANLEHWAAANPAIASLTLSVAYLAVLVALVAVLAASAANTALGFVVIVLFAVMVLVTIAVATYTVMPERTPS